LRKSVDALASKVSVLLDQDLYESIQRVLEATAFSTVDEYVNYTLRTALARQKKETLKGKSGNEGDNGNGNGNGNGNEDRTADMSKEDMQVVTARLKALGYI
jgi:Arc/MetJ-type ribon-helix-helix transcriptional regulator